MSCLIVGQRAPVWEHLCNYCATRISTPYAADRRPSPPSTTESLTDLGRKASQTGHYKRVSRYQSTTELNCRLGAGGFRMPRQNEARLNGSAARHLRYDD